MSSTLILLIVLLCLIQSTLSIKLKMQFFSDSKCKSLANELEHDLGNCDPLTGVCDQTCHAWQRNAIGGSHDDSANAYMCYKDWGVTYIQYVEKDDCSGFRGEKKEARIGCCISEPSGNLWSYISTGSGSAIDTCAPAPDTLPKDCTAIY